MVSTGNIGTMRELKSKQILIFCISQISIIRTYVCPGGEERTGPCPVTASERNVLYENRMLGLPRIRQLRRVGFRQNYS